MPILDIQIVLRPGEAVPANLAAALAEAAAKVLHSPPASCWVKVSFLAERHYAEAGSPGGVHPVFVDVLKDWRPPPAELAAEASALARAFAGIVGQPAENIHILYLESAAGRIAFGGRVGSE